MEPRLTKLAELKELYNQSPKSKVNTEFPWEYFAIVTFNARLEDTYLRDFKGLNLLYNWLGPFTKPTTESTCSYSEHLINYKTSKLSSLLGIDWRHLIALLLREYSNGTIRNS